MIDNSLNTIDKIYQSFIRTAIPDDMIMYYNDSQVSVKVYMDGVDRYTRHLINLGVKPGVAIGYSMPNCPEVFYLFTAISRLGACAVPLFHMFPDVAKVDIFQKSRVQLVIVSEMQYDSFKAASEKAGCQYRIVTTHKGSACEYDFESSIDHIDLNSYYMNEVSPDMPLVIASSSGTTGIPKLVAMTQANIASEVYASIDLITPINSNIIKGYRYSIAFPLSTSGIITIIGLMFGGISIIFSQDVSPLRFLKLMSQWKAEGLTAPPAYFESILSLPMLDTFDLTSVETMAGGMDFISPSLVRRMKEKFINLNSLANGYGLIETANVFMVCKQNVEEGFYKPTSKMRLCSGTSNAIEVRDEGGSLVSPGNEGELYVRGSNVVRGYLNNAEETARSFGDGWFKTGDIVRNEGDGYITLLGRRKYLIKRGGKSISPVFVQDHLNKVEGIKVSAVVGVPHQLYGEMVWAFIVVKDGYKVELKDIMKHCRKELPNYMVPDQVLFIDEIPKNPGAGKVNYERLKEVALSELGNI
ncbi:class I adenylate-forming enzyme family protein [Pseudobacteroides cellulosolvens]|uniref:class I adenylate-forming enzyme family protein n=1 Tax=Pseudobacteroides cellulosolvens TaxID=35825 RepID=UPI00055E49AD|nr:class I adenylate-forming enzyme family protein [Pseudobacteroides cellulosolvens]